ncbi:hypothetical protein [Aestuariivivens sediminis]|uniref:hypothetical protein n=1 Tax=Aestuariivivens sediminis TaxID=2913557 RepID=UPI001F56E5F5|nr:hypothetical protein [Aestuariivivens sediminis]
MRTTITLTKHFVVRNYKMSTKTPFRVLMTCKTALHLMLVFSVLCIFNPGSAQSAMSHHNEPSFITDFFTYYLEGITSKTANIYTNDTNWHTISTYELSGSSVLNNAVMPPTKLSLEQVRDGDGSVLGSVEWQNGNAGASNAHYVEGWGIPYRLIFTNLTDGNHSVDIAWDIKHSDKHAIDFISYYELLNYPIGSHAASFGHEPEPIDPTDGYGASIVSGPNYGNIPIPTLPAAPDNLFDDLALAMKERMTIWNGTINSMAYISEGSLIDASSTTMLRIHFTSTAATVILSWSGHIATEDTWGIGNSAKAVSGSPYHTRVLQWSPNDDDVFSSVGNQDRSLSAAAVIDPPPCEITGPDPVCPSSTGHVYQNNAIMDPSVIPDGYNYEWSISGDGSIPPNSDGPTVSVTAGSSCNGSYTLTLTIRTDADIFVTSCSKIVSVIDSTAPTLTGTIPSGQTGIDDCIANVPTGPTEATIAAQFTDGCGGAISVVKSGSPTGDDCSWSVTYTYAVTDNCGNSYSPSPTVTYSGGDDTAPTLTGSIPSGQTGIDDCIANAPAGPTESDIANQYTDGCGGAISVVKSGSPTGDDCSWSVTYNYTIADKCGNYATAVDITYSGGDDTAPSLTGSIPSGQTGIDDCISNAPAGPTESDIANQYTDGCGGSITVVKTGSPTGDDCSWSVTYNYTIADKCGNYATAVDITYSGGDDTAPSLTGSIPSGQTGIDDCIANAPAGPTESDIANQYTDGCGGSITVVKTGSPTGDDCSWSVTYNYTIADKCGNYATAVDITYSGGDDTAPSLTGSIPSGQTGIDDCIANAPAGPTESDIANQYTDGCGGSITVVKTGSPTGDDCSWSVTYNYTIADKCGNYATAVDITYSGGDDTDPVIDYCPSDITLECDDSILPANTGSATATDNCDDVTPTYSDSQVDNGCQSIITRTWTASDVCGNSTQCVQYIIVRDTEAPTITCTTEGNATFSDNCSSEPNITRYYRDNGSSRNWTAIDESGNIATMSCDLSPAPAKAAPTKTKLNPKNALIRAYPNPFRDSVKFVVDIPEDTEASLKLVNLQGQVVQTVYEGALTKGIHTFEARGFSYNPSLLIYILNYGGEKLTGKLIKN